jgi:hypothetical protein
VGPSLVEKIKKDVPNGMAITDTLVAGVHPYVGGKLAISIVLARVRRDSYAKRLLQVVEQVATAFPAGKALEPHLKVADAVLDGVQHLFGTADTVPLAGHRFEYNDGLTDWLEPGFFALINSDENQVRPESLGVVGARLRDGMGDSAPAYRAHDYLLYSLRPLARRRDVTELAMHRIYKTALRDAASTDPGSWDRAKAGLVTLYQELLTSPDLIWSQVQELMTEFTERLQHVHERTKEFTVLGDGKLARVSGDESVIGPFRGKDARRRLDKLSEIHELLALE